MPISSLFRAATVGTVVAVTACASRQPALNELPVHEVAGHYRFGGSGSWFVQCGSAAADSSWVVFTDRAVEQRDSIAAAGVLAPGRQFFVRWRTAVTERGDAGPRGQGHPAFLVREILVLRPRAEGDCP